MAKTKKMAFGGMAAGIAPRPGMTPQRPGMGAGAAPQKFMSDALRGGTMKPPQGMMGGNGPAPADALRPMPAIVRGSGAAPAGVPEYAQPYVNQMKQMAQGPAPAPSPAMLQKFGPPQGAAGMPVGTRMGGMMKEGGAVKASKMGAVKKSKPTMKSASTRGDGIAQKGKTKGRMV